MNLFLRMACRVIERRMCDGEQFEQIIADYPKLTEDDTLEIKSALGLM